MEDRVGKHYVLQQAKSRAGGLSTVRKAVDMRDLSTVAVKFVEAGKDDLTLRLFTRETKALRSVSHRNIVRFRDSGIDEMGTYFLVLDWVNRNLNDLLVDRPWSNWDDLCRNFVMPLLDGLAHAHLKRLEHRDIKPANILIDDEGNPLLADFGISKLRGDEPHSEHTVQGFRSGPYAPPEMESKVPYVRDVYSVGVVILQCLSSTKITDFPDIQPALEAATVPPDVRSVLATCVATEPSDRPANAMELAMRFRELTLQRASASGQQTNMLWLDLTGAASVQIHEDSSSGESAAGIMQADLVGQVHVEFALDRETGQRDRNKLRLYGAERRYSIAINSAGVGGLKVIAARSVPFEALDAGRRRGLAVPPIFSWVASRPADLRSSAKAGSLLSQLLDEHYESLSKPSEAETADERFDVWLRVLDARADLARGEHLPLRFKGWRPDGRRTIFELTEPHEIDLVGSDWEVFEPLSGRRYGFGEVIEQDATEITLLSSKRLMGLPKSATLRPYDAPSTISLNRQRSAVLAVRAGITPNPELTTLLLDPQSNDEPVAEPVPDWFTELDSAKQQAVRLALGTSEALVVKGPPGHWENKIHSGSCNAILAG